MAKLTRITPPTTRLVTAENLSVHGKIEIADEDEFAEECLDTAEEAAEEYTWRKFLTQTWDQYFDGFSDPLVLRYPPLASVTSVTYTDADGVSQTLSTDIYEAGSQRGIGVVRRKYDQEWPSTRAHEDVVIVRFDCGYGDPDDVPERIKHAIRLHAIHQFRYREGQEMTDRWKDSLSPFRVMEF